MPVVYNDTSVLFRRHASDDSWHQAVLTVSELESGLHLLMVSGKHQGLATQHDLQRNDLLVALIHNAWIMNMDEHTYTLSWGYSNESEQTWPQVRFRSRESLWTAAEELLKYRRARNVRAEEARSSRLVLANYVKGM